MTTSLLIRTLVVDDSAFVRKIVREMLGHSPLIEVVGVARDGEEALVLAESLKPDVITCDLIMPGIGGVEFVRRQMAKRPIPILVLTASPEDAAQVVEALSAGAVDLVRKPTALATAELFSIRDQLIEKVKGAAGIHVENLAPAPAFPAPTPVAPHALKVDIVVLGISTGGPQALRRLLPQFPADFPVPIAMVLHMPVGYTALYAEKLNEICRLKVKEASEGDVIRSGMAFLAPAGRHMSFRKTAKGTVVVQLSVNPIDKIHRPSVDVLFQSAAEIYRGRVLAAVMTGMGDDGKQGSAWIKAQGGTVLTEDEKSCVIYGMPRSVAEAGLSDAAVLLDNMAQAITERI